MLTSTSPDLNHKHQDDLGPVLYNEIIHNDTYKIKNFFKKCDVPINTIIDIGANIGYFTLLTSVIYPAAKKILVEPNPENVKTLITNFSHFNNINIINKALGDGKNVSMKYDTNWSGSDSVEFNPNGNIESIPFEKIMAGVDGYYILKVDCEGGEKYLKNVDPAVFQNCLYFACEFHENENNDLESWENWLKKTFVPVFTIGKQTTGQYAGSNLYNYFIVRNLPPEII